MALQSTVFELVALEIFAAVLQEELKKMVNKQVRIIRNEFAKNFQSSLETVTHSADSNTVQYHGFRSYTNVKCREITEKSHGD